MKRAGLAHTLKRLRCMAYVDVGPPDATVFVSGMGRSGTTWLAALINHRFDHRVIFEPFRPEIVPVAKVFGPFAYVPPTDTDPARRDAALRILAGRTPRGPVDRLHRGIIFRRRIIKGVRSNLMLGWLKSLRPAMPLMVIIRHPFAVAASWLRLGWGNVADGTTRELDVIARHQQLLEDFPVVERTLREIDRANVFDSAVAQWCVLHLVPFSQVSTEAAHFVFFEDLVLEPDATFRAVAAYLGIEVNHPAFQRAVSTATETDFLKRGHRADRAHLLGDWRQHLTPSQVDRGREIINAFGLDHLYDEHGKPTGLTPMRVGS